MPPFVPTDFPIISGISKAIDAAKERIKEKFREMFKPIRELGDKVTALGIIWEIFQQKLGVFFTELKKRFPILQTLETFVTDLPENVKTLSSTLSENLGRAFALVKERVEKDVLPKLKELKDQGLVFVNKLSAKWAQIIREKISPAINEVFIPDLIKLRNAWLRGVNKIFSKGAKIINEDVVPAIKTNLIPELEKLIVPLLPTINELVQTLVKLIGEELVAAIELLGKAWDTFKADILNPFIERFESLGGVLDQLVILFQKLIEKIEAIDVTSLLPFLGTSPSPLEEGLRGINSALREMSSIRLPAFQNALQLQAGGFGGASPMFRQMGAQTTVNINTGGNQINSPMDLAMVEVAVTRIIQRQFA